MSGGNKYFWETWKASPSTGNARVDLASALLDQHSRVLDVGCGEGLLGKTKRFDRYVGLDIAEGRVPELFVRGDLSKEVWPIRNRAFDTVVSLDVIEHLAEPQQFLCEIRRILAPGGYCYIATPNMRYIVRPLHILRKGRFPITSGDHPYPYDGGHVRYLCPADLRELMLQAGIVPVETYAVISQGIDNWKYKILRKILPRQLAVELLGIEILVIGRRPLNAE